jgi:hypothetical protein
MNKHNWNPFLVAGLILMLLSISAVACGPQTQVPGTGGSSPSQADVPTSQIPKNYADFEVGPLTIARSGISVGEMATVSATVTNTGGVGGIYKAVLLIDGKEVNQEDVSVGPRGIERVTFQVTRSAAGSYKVEIGKSAAILNVYGWPYKIQYDAGSAYGESLSVAGDYGHMVRFSPPATPFRVQKVELYATAIVTKDSDWTDKYITVRIWDSEGNRQLWSDDFPWRTVWGETWGFWHEMDVPNVSVNGDFYVEIVTHSYQFGDEIITYHSGPEVSPAVFVGRDKPNPYVDEAVSSDETRSGVSNMGKLVEVPVKYQGSNWLIRVEGDGSL